MAFEVIKIFFLKFLLLPLIAILLAGAMILVKKKNALIRNKVLIVYILIGIITIALPGVLGFTGNTFSPYWYLFAQLYYLGIGTWNVTLVQKFFPANEAKPLYGFLLESLITLICMLLGAYIFIFVYNWLSPFEGYAVMASTSICVFALPLIFYYCFLQFIAIPFDIYKTWEYSRIFNDVNDDFAGKDFNKLMVLNLELAKNMETGTRFRVKAKAPDAIVFGNWFARFIEDYNTRYPQAQIEVYGFGNQSYSWIFYTKKSIFHFRKYIDFDKSITENKITDKDIIVCKRVLSHDMIQTDKENTTQ